MSNTTPANWFPDPKGRHQHRYWDGVAWTDHVSDNGITSIDPVNATIGDKIDAAFTVGTDPDAEKIREMVTGGGIRGAGIAEPAGAGGGTLFTEPILVVSQKAKLIEVTNQYSVFDQHGGQLGFVSEIGQSAAKKVLRVLTDVDKYLKHRLEITDRTGAVQLRLTRPGKVFKSTIIVESAAGAEIGRIVQENMMGKIRFNLQASGQTLGSIRAENWRAWNFRIEDAGGNEIARITKTWEGLAKTLFTTADNYVVQLHTAIPQPLLSLVVASALSVDTALKQDQRGLN
ncbi:MAG: hypothetical protein QOD72_3101 [Acidimicrobiaceae bacterium]|jgi:uncharacterized protein YxjI|nr:hypothetical protein [Acidimicrobiaceae bacterium]